ncbi:hypothetical protein QL285_003422 [Trifolium repens]|jgi:hypothetical protein|nr:hypothetical protein QL285_003422 [Trifolium repens]
MCVVLPLRVLFSLSVTQQSVLSIFFMRPNTKLVAYQGRGELFLDHVRYKRLVVKLNYLIVTRPDISFVVIVVKCEPNSQFT